MARKNQFEEKNTYGEKLKQLEAKVREKDEVIAELMAEYLKAKKKTGENS